MASGSQIPFKSPSTGDQKKKSKDKDEVKYFDIFPESAQRLEDDLKKQPTIDSEEHPDLKLLRDRNVREELRSNTRCKQEFTNRCKAERGTQYSNETHGEKGVHASLQCRDVAVKVGVEVIRWALEKYRKDGQWPKTADQKNVAEKKALKEENKRLAAENKSLREQSAAAAKVQEQDPHDSDTEVTAVEDGVPSSQPFSTPPSSPERTSDDFSLKREVDEP